MHTIFCFFLYFFFVFLCYDLYKIKYCLNQTLRRLTYLCSQCPDVVCLSLLTMTNPNQLCDVLLFVCSKMADETNLSSKLPVADRTREV